MRKAAETSLFGPPILLRSAIYKPAFQPPQRFPFNVPVIASLGELRFESPVTFLVGENGCGKSTLLEALACAIGSITVGVESVETDTSLSAVRELAGDFKLSWRKKTHRGFLMRSEDFFGYARKLSATREGLERDLDETDREYEGKSPTARLYARSPYQKELGALHQSYGEDLDAHSHGESYLTLFQSRFVPEGIYLLDEPEAPLSPLRQLSFLSLLHQMVGQKAQFIIATHSPILVAYPNASIWSFENDKIIQRNYADLEHVRITRDFLSNPERYLHELLEY